MRQTMVIDMALRLGWLLLVSSVRMTSHATTNAANATFLAVDPDFEAFYATQLNTKLAYWKNITGANYDRRYNNNNKDWDDAFRSFPQGGRRSCGECCGYGPIQDASLFGMNSFYKKVLNFRGFRIASSAYVSDAALYEAALTLDVQTKYRPDLFQAMVNDGVHMAVLGRQEQLLDVPEYSSLSSDWNYARGVSATRWIPVTSCAEENLLCLSTDVYPGESICSHENAHTLTGSMGSLDSPRYVEPRFPYRGIDLALAAIYFQSVIRQGLWANTYAASSRGEYLAEGAQSFFNTNQAGPAQGDGVHNHIDTRDKLRAYDPALYDLLTRIFPTDVHTIACPKLSGCDCATFVCPSHEGSAPTVPNNPVPAPVNPPTPSPVPVPNNPVPAPVNPPTPSPVPVPTNPVPAPVNLPTPSPIAVPAPVNPPSPSPVTLPTNPAPVNTRTPSPVTVPTLTPMTPTLPPGAQYVGQLAKFLSWAKSAMDLIVGLLG